MQDRETVAWCQPGCSFKDVYMYHEGERFGKAAERYTSWITLPMYE